MSQTVEVSLSMYQRDVVEASLWRLGLGWRDLKTMLFASGVHEIQMLDNLATMGLELRLTVPDEWERPGYLPVQVAALPEVKR